MYTTLHGHSPKHTQPCIHTAPHTYSTLHAYTTLHAHIPTTILHAPCTPHINNIACTQPCTCTSPHIQPCRHKTPSTYTQPCTHTQVCMHTDPPQPCTCINSAPTQSCVYTPTHAHTQPCTCTTLSAHSPELSGPWITGSRLLRLRDGARRFPDCGDHPLVQETLLCPPPSSAEAPSLFKGDLCSPDPGVPARSTRAHPLQVQLLTHNFLQKTLAWLGFWQLTLSPCPCPNPTPLQRQGGRDNAVHVCPPPLSSSPSPTAQDVPGRNPQPPTHCLAAAHAQGKSQSSRPGAGRRDRNSFKTNAPLPHSQGQPRRRTRLDRLPPNCPHLPSCLKLEKLKPRGLRERGEEEEQEGEGRGGQKGPREESSPVQSGGEGCQLESL